MQRTVRGIYSEHRAVAVDRETSQSCLIFSHNLAWEMGCSTSAERHPRSSGDTKVNKIWEMYLQVYGARFRVRILKREKGQQRGRCCTDLSGS